MASTTAAEAAVPEDDDDDLEQASPPEGGSATGRDPWQGSRLGGTGPPSPDAQAEYREFLQHLQRRTRPGRRHRADESDEGGEPDDRSNAGPPPTWDGTTSFRDYLVRARLCLATTKVKSRARGPLLLKSLSSTPFDDLKHLARDDSWMEDPQNGQLLLKMMDTKELYGKDEREEMLQSLVTVTYTLRRSKGESHKAFFSRWENAIRKLHEHSIELPKEYLGFLLTMALQLSSEEVKLLMNYTQGRLGPKDVKDWVRIHETDLDLKNKASENKKKTDAVHYFEGDEVDPSDNGEANPDGDTDLEVLLSAMQDLGDGTAIGTTDDEDGVFDEGEAREVLATMIKEHSKRRTFSAVNTAKKAKNLARGFGSAARAQPFGPRPRNGYPDKFAGGTYKVSIEALKRRTKCSKCGQVGHWHRECPSKSSSSVASSSTANQHGVNFLEMGANEVHFLGFDEFKAIKEAVLNTNSGLSMKPSPTSASSGLPAKRDYVAVQSRSFHEVHYLTQSNQGLVEDAQCATVDTGCQRTAVGAKTLSRFLAEFPDDMHAVYRPECHSFKSINGVTSTKRIACVPTSLGQHGSILRPAIFESPETQDAPFLLSLPFLLHCQASLHLDPQEGMWMDLKRFNHRVPLLIGPTGALRVPLQAFSSQLKATLRSALGKLEGDQEEILMTRSLSSCHSDRASSPYPCPEPSDRSDHVPGQQALPSGRFASGRKLARLLEAHGSPVSGGLCSRFVDQTASSTRTVRRWSSSSVWPSSSTCRC